MQNCVEHKKVCGKLGNFQLQQAVPGGRAAAGRSRRQGYFPASSAGTSFSETELMQNRWSVGVP